MGIEEFLAIGIVGAALSGVMKFIKTKYPDMEGGKAKALVITLSIIIGGAFFLFGDTTWWAGMIGVLASASTVYALALK